MSNLIAFEKVKQAAMKDFSLAEAVAKEHSLGWYQLASIKGRRECAQIWATRNGKWVKPLGVVYEKI